MPHHRDHSRDRRDRHRDDYRDDYSDGYRGDYRDDCRDDPRRHRDRYYDEPPPPVMHQPQPAPPPVVYQQPAPAVMAPSFTNFNPVMSNNNNVANNNATNVVINNSSGGGRYTYKDRKWSTGMCGCFGDCESLCCVLMFPTCYLCYMSHLMDEHVCMPACVPNSLLALRLKMRMLEDIEGSICKDCVAVSCCYPLVLCQLKREHDFCEKAYKMKQRGH